jgi:hypothetical protein
VADPAAGVRLRDRLPRLPGREDPRRPDGTQPRLLPGDRRQPRRRARRARDLVPAHRGRQVLATGPHRPQAARRSGRARGLCRRPDRLPRRDRGRLPPDLPASSIRSARAFASCLTATSAPSPPTSSASTPRSTRTPPPTSSSASPRSGTPATDDQPQLARALGTHRAVPGLPARRSPRRLHHG